VAQQKLDWPGRPYGADLFFQIFGFAAFLLPAAILVLGFGAGSGAGELIPRATLAGYGLLLLSLPALISLLTFIRHPGAITRRGGFVSTGLSGLLAS